MDCPPKKVAVVERFKKELMHGLSTKNVAVVERFNKSQCMDCPPKKVAIGGDSTVACLKIF